MSPNGELFNVPVPLPKQEPAKGFNPAEIVETVSASKGYLPMDPHRAALPRNAPDAAARVAIDALSEEDGDAEEDPIAAGDAPDEELDLLSPITEIVAPDALKGYNAAPDSGAGDAFVMDEDDDQAEAAK